MRLNMIDPHLHLIAYPNAGRYEWLKPENPPFWQDKSDIAQPFGLADIALRRPGKGGAFKSIQVQAPQNQNVDKFVHIEAGFDNQQPWREIAWLEGLFADKDDVLKTCRSIACCNLLLAPELFKQQIKELESYSSVVGVRDILDEQAVDYLATASVKENLAWLATRGLIFECQCDCSDPHVVEQMCLFLAANPEARWVINHCGGKVFTDGSATDEHWVTLAQLATFPNVYIKASGWEMHNRDFSWNDVETTVTALIDEWGKDRVMIASNFPLLTWRMSYAEFWEGMVERFAEIPELLYKNAERVYFR